MFAEIKITLPPIATRYRTWPYRTSMHAGLSSMWFLFSRCRALNFAISIMQGAFASLPSMQELEGTYYKATW